ncbi:MAG: hypothetical protein RLZ42_1682 [Armatimonadota bacterium]|jgi:hypothetical protein
MHIGKAFALFAVTLSVLPAQVAQAQTAPAVVAKDGTYSWTVNFTKGEAPRYRTYIKISGRQADESGDVLITTRGESKHDVKDVLPDGTATYEQLDTLNAATFQNMPLPADKKPPVPVVITYSKAGIMVKRVNPAADPFDRSQKGVPNLMCIPAPIAPVKIGESWKSEIANLLVKGQKISITQTLVAAEKVMGVDCLKLTAKYDFPTTYGAQESEISKVDSTVWIEVKTGQVFKIINTIVNPLLPFPAAKVTSTAITTKIVAGQNDKEDADGEKLILPAAKAK